MGCRVRKRNSFPFRPKNPSILPGHNIHRYPLNFYQDPILYGAYTPLNTINTPSFLIFKFKLLNELGKPSRNTIPDKITLRKPYESSLGSA